jgi:phthiocerol/phenolphthiocerol synthesis type-I polyketide synthase E
MSDTRNATGPSGLEVAVIGMACRFPGAGNLDEFWRNLLAGVESITHYTDEELAAHAGDSPELLAQPNYIKVGRVIEGDTLFDSTLFGFSPREAELLDPQQRLFLECAWEALEHAGHDAESFPGLVGVYAGVKLSTYLWHIYSHPQLLASVGELNASIANDRDYLSTRVSYKLGLGGPSLTVQTACSTSLVAVHLACQALLGGECQMALAGGVSVKTRQRAGYFYHQGEILSPDGRIRAFDAKANGTIFGNGLGIVVLRRLEDALADGDRIYGVIRGTAVNNDSSRRAGFTAPGADGQERVILAAHAAADVHPDSISYVEAHGTGTQVGDPIEVAALTRAFRARTQRKGFCGIGSVKTNIGHLASAAGVAGLIKTCLALDHKQIPPSLLFEQPNPQIDFPGSPFYVVQRTTPWEDGGNGTPRRAGVSAFGIGGTNAHAVVEEAPPRGASGPSRPWQLLLLSAKTDTALHAVTANVARHLRDHPAANGSEMADVADVAFTLQVGRRALDHRRMLVCASGEEAAGALESLDPARVYTRAAESRQTPVVFLFPGQGAQHARMLAGVYAGEALFRDEVDRCAELAAPHLGLDVRELLFPPGEDGEQAERRLEQTAITQPALFIVEYALARLWMSWGVQPAAMLGHSIGEYVAACLAGVMSLPDALAVVAARGRLMQELPPGAMLSVPLEPAEVEPLLGSQLSLAAHNAPRRVVVSGPREAVGALAEQLAGRGVECRRLHTSHAFHSRMMEPALPAFVAALSRVELAPPRLPYISNLTGTWATAAEATDPGYWARHLLGTVRFSDGLRLLLAEPQRVLLEVGPGQTLCALARQQPGRASGQVIVASARQVKDQRDDHAYLLGALGQAWLAGAVVDWRGFYAGEVRHRLALPTYPFERQEYWVPFSQANLGLTGLTAAPQTKELADWFYLPYWKPSSPRPPRPQGEADLSERAGDRPGPGAGGAGGWLVFADDLGLGVELAERLRERGEPAAIVMAGQKFAAHAGRVFEIAPARPEDYDSLLAALTGAGDPDQVSRLPERIVHLWTVTGGDRPAFAHAPGSAEEMGFYSLIFLAQALGRQTVEGRIELTVVSNGVHELGPGERLCPEKALVLGPCKVMPQEYPYLSCRSIDVVPPAAGPARGDLVELLLDEMADETSEQVIAYRDGRRWLQAFEPVRLGEAPPERLPLRQRGVYLITGGLGGIGLVLAEHLASTAGARLVLTGRTALPPRERWAEELARHPEGDPAGDRIRQMRRIEEMGAEVMALAADVADERRMGEVVAAARERFGALHGVIHAAGVAGGGIAQNKTRAVAAEVLAPKVRGARALEAALAGAELDFLVLCSSTIAVLGSFGQVDYCAANCFLDAFARDYAARHGVRTVAINWGAWGEVGMAVNTAAPESFHALREQAARASSAAAEPAAPPRPAAPPLHPLLERLEIDEPERKVFATTFSAARHWVLAEHWVADVPTMPGVTYLEMAREAYRLATGEPLADLREVFFLSPMMIAAQESRETRTVLERQGAGYRFRIHSRPDGNPSAGGGRDAGRGADDAGWQEHAFGEIGPAAAAARRIDLDAVRRRCTKHVEIARILLGGEKDLVYWGPRWQIIKTVEYGVGEALGLIELPPELAGDLDDYGLHPALLDVATSMLGLWPYLNSGQSNEYLPLSYGRLSMNGPLPARLYCHVRTEDHADTQNETISADLDVVDETGAVVVAIEGFVEKRIGTAGGRLQATARRLAGHSAAATTAGAEDAGPRDAGVNGGARAPAAGKRPGRFAAGGMLNSEGVEVFRRILSRRLGPQVVQSPRDLLALLEQMAQARSQDVAKGVAQLAPSRAAHPRPNVQTAFVAPRNELEQRLAQVWQDVLGIDTVGVHDNFYELGGDSVLGVQVLARARQAGVELTSNQLFQHQTIAELAVAVGGAAAPTSAAAETSAMDAQGASAPAGSFSTLADEVLARIAVDGDVEDIYPLSPLQHGLLFHGLSAPSAALYQEQLRFPMTGDLDLERLEHAWQLSIGHHPVLRTSFVWEDLDQPLQAVCRRVTMPIHAEDMRGLPPDARQERLEAWRRADREEPFRFGEAPLMRCRVARVADDRCEVLWSHHHLLMDGWSSPLLLREVFSNYLELGRGGEPRLLPVRPFRDYIDWLQRRDVSADEEFWRRTLAGFTRPNGIGADRPASGRLAAVSDFASIDGQLPEAMTAALHALARQTHMTLNNLTQGMWALVLGHVAGESDVIFGISASTRPAALAGIESVIGLFINTLPLRARLGAQAPLLPWLADLQSWQQEMLDHVQAPPVEVKRWSELPPELPLFESVFDFWNFPLDAVELQSFSIGEARYEVATHYPLSMRVIPGPGLRLEITYDRRRFDEATAARLLGCMRTALEALAEGAAATLADVDRLLAASERRARRRRAGEIAGLAQEKLRHGLRAGRRRGTRPEPAP